MKPIVALTIILWAMLRVVYNNLKNKRIDNTIIKILKKIYLPL